MTSQELDRFTLEDRLRAMKEVHEYLDARCQKVHQEYNRRMARFLYLMKFVGKTQVLAK